MTAPFAAVFGLLVAAEDAYLGWLLRDAEPSWGWYLLLPAVLALAAVLALVGGGQAFWWSLLLLVVPVGGLSLALQRPVRDWTRPASRRRGVRGR